MPQSSKIPVYVSYSRAEEQQNGTISKMQKELQDIDFQIDTGQVKYRDNFMNFIARIGKADYIVVVFSEDYLKSFYCMYELTKIMQHGGDLKTRVFSIRNERYDLSNVNNQKHIKSYWQEVLDAGSQRPDHLTQYGKIEEIEEIHNQLDDIFDRFSTTHAPTAKELAPTFKLLFDDSYQVIRDWLKEVLPQSRLQGKHKCSDKSFVVDVTQEIADILEQFPPLYKKISAKFGDIDSEDALAKTLCGYENKKELIIPLLIKICESAVKLTKARQTTEKVDELKDGIRMLLNCLCVLSIDSGWVRAKDNEYAQIIELPVQTSFGQVSAAGRIGKVVPSLTVEGRNKIVGKDEINPYKLGTWSDARNLAVNAILRFVYNRVFDTPEKNLNDSENGTITEAERVDLNNEIKLSAEAGTRHYYCMLQPEDMELHFLNEPNLIQKLKELLPALDIFEVKDTIGNTVFLVADEQLLSQAYHHFLKQLDEW